MNLNFVDPREADKYYKQLNKQYQLNEKKRAVALAPNAYDVQQSKIKSIQRDEENDNVYVNVVITNNNRNIILAVLDLVDLLD